jgi:hypothetical protein
MMAKVRRLAASAARVLEDLAASSGRVNVDMARD